MSTRPSIDVSHLPAIAVGPRSPSWWGNVLFMAIETTTVLLLMGSYFYLWRNFPQGGWPPPRVDEVPPIERPVPDLLFGTVNAVLLAATVPLMAWVHRYCLRRFAELERHNAGHARDVPGADRPGERPAAVVVALVAMALLACAAIALRYYEFPALKFKWNANAYASLVWALLGLHMTYIAIEAFEFAVVALWVVMFGLGEDQASEVALTADYWYWTVGIGLLVYGIVYWFPRVA